MIESASGPFAKKGVKTRLKRCKNSFFGASNRTVRFFGNLYRGNHAKHWGFWKCHDFFNGNCPPIKAECADSSISLENGKTPTEYGELLGLGADWHTEGGCVRGKVAPTAAAPNVATRCGSSSTQPYL